MLGLGRHYAAIVLRAGEVVTDSSVTARGTVNDKTDTRLAVRGGAKLFLTLAYSSGRGVAVFSTTQKRTEVPCYEPLRHAGLMLDCLSMFVTPSDYELVDRLVIDKSRLPPSHNQVPT